MAQNSRLTKSQQVKLADARTITAIGKLGEGGQGTVYRVQIDGTKEERALKWYFIEEVNEPRDFYAHLQNNIDNGSPSVAFVWPEALTEWVKGTFGYVMPIIPSGYYEFTKYVMAKVRFESLDAIVNAALNLVSAFKALHLKGYNYQDLNYKNFVVAPRTGDVLLLDNDNVRGHGQWSGVQGYKRFMAPEVVRGEKMPDTHTDRHSLALNLFYILIGDHPLEGSKTNVPCFTDKHDIKFFGTEPLFMFDKYDSANAPRAGQDKNAIALWPCFPSYMHKAFQKSFGQDSLLHSQGRLLEQEWLPLLVRLKSSIVRCPNCSAKMFLESKGTTICLGCNQRVEPLGYLKFAKKRSNINVSLPIFDGVRLFEYYMDVNSEDFQTIAAAISVEEGKFLLRNNSTHNWTVTAPDGRTKTKQRGDDAVLRLGFKIDFGNGNVAEIIPN